MNINNAILHVLDFESCANVFAQTPLSLANKTAKRYVTSQAKRTLSNMDRRLGTFEEGSSFEAQLRAYLRGERDFVGLSTDIAQFLARELGSMEKTQSTDVLVVDFTGDAVCEALPWEDEPEDEWEEPLDTGDRYEAKTVGPGSEFREAVGQCIAEARLAGSEEGQDGHGVSGMDYFDLAVDYSWDAADPAGETISAGEIREQILLPYQDYSLQALKELAEQAPIPAFRALLERFISEGWPSAAMREVNEVISHLFMLWVGPYLTMGKRPR